MSLDASYMERRHPSQRRTVVTVWFALLLSGLLLVVGCDVGPTNEDGSATVNIRVEDFGGVHQEGFRLTYAITDPGGVVVSKKSWNSAVMAAAAKQERNADIRDFYTTVVPETVPAGRITVEADIHIGNERPLPECRIELRLTDGETTTVVFKLLPSSDGKCATVAG